MMKLGQLIASLLMMLWAGMAAAQMRDADEIVRTLFIETLRANPTVLQGERADDARYFALNTYIQPGISKTYPNLTKQEQRVRLDEAGAWIAGQLQTPTVLPLDIEVSFPGNLLIDKDGALSVRPSGQKKSIISGTLEDVTFRAPLQTPSARLRPVQPFDLTSLHPDDAVAAQLKDLAQSRQGVMVVAQMTVTDIGTAQQNGIATAGGRVTGVALHRLTAVDRKLVADDLIWQLPDPPAATGTIARADIDQVLRLQKHGDAYFDRLQNGNRPLTNLLQWQALAALPVEDVIARRLAPDLFWRLYSEFTPRSLQDSLISPDRLDQSRRGFAPTLNDIDIRQTEDAVIRALWPQLAAALSQGPLPVISTASYSLSEYDFARGGFALTPRTNGWLVTGPYPVLTTLPDFLTLPQDQATTLLDRITALDGAGHRNVTLRAAFDLTLRQAVFAPEGPLQLPQVVPGFDLQAVSFHAAMQHPDADSLMRNKLMDLDPSGYRGPERPIADQDELAKWAAIAEDRGARGEDLIAAAMTVAKDPAALAQGLNRQGHVSDPLTAAQDLALPAPPVLTGQMSFARQGAGWSAADFRWTYYANESGLTAPNIELADTAILSNIPLTPEQEKALGDVGGRVQYRATFEPVTAALKGSKPVVYIRLTQVTLYSQQKDETGLPLVRIVLTPQARPAVVEDAADPVQTPKRVVLDHDYLDLLMVAELGGKLDDATIDRMLLDRLHRELRTKNDADLPWGRFFDPMPQRLNRVERAALLPHFRAWQAGRAAALPQDVILAVADSSLQAPCGVQVYAAPAQSGSFSPGTHALLEALDYEQVAKSVSATLQSLDKMAREVPDRQPVLADKRLVQIGGRPIYALLRTNRHPAASACTGNERFDAVTDGFDPAQSGTVDAVAVLHSPVLMPNERRLVEQTRHFARLRGVSLLPPEGASKGARSLGTLRIDLDVTDSVFYGQDALPQRHIPNPTGKPVRVSVAQVAELSVPPAQAFDIKGLTLQTSPDDMQVMLLANGPAQRNYAQGFAPEVTPKPVPGQGTLPATDMVTQANMLIDGKAGEVLLSLSDARLDRVRLGLGRLTQYDATEISGEGVLGALLKKYGQPAFSKETRRGGRPLARYAWGYNPAISMPQCMPDLTNTAGRQMRESFPINGDEDRAYLALADALPWPVFGPVAQGVPDFSTCQPIVVAEIAAVGNKIHLVTWLLDPSQITSLSWQTKDAPDEKQLLDGAADIDL